MDLHRRVFGSTSSPTAPMIDAQGPPVREIGDEQDTRQRRAVVPLTIDDEKEIDDVHQ